MNESQDFEFDQENINNRKTRDRGKSGDFGTVKSVESEKTKKNYPESQRNLLEGVDVSNTKRD